MGDVKNEPMDHGRETPPPKFSNPRDALSYYTRKTPTPFPSSVTRSQTNSGHVVSLEFNRTRYEAVHPNPECAEQILAVYILYGEFAQDSVDLYNYFLKVTRTECAVLHSDQVSADVEVMKSRGSDANLKVARVVPFHSAAHSSGVDFQEGNSASLSTSMPDDSDFNSGSKREWQLSKSIPSGVPEKIRRTENNNHAQRRSWEATEEGEVRSEHNENEDDDVLRGAGGDGFGGKDDREPSSETTQLKMMVIMEAYACKQLLLFTPKGLQDGSEISVDERIKKFEKFISSVDHDFDIQHWSFMDIPNGFSPFYTLLKVRNKLTFLETGDEPVFVGKGQEKLEAWVNAIDVATDFVKRSIALNFMLVGPSESAVDKLARLMKIIPAHLPFKDNFNRIFEIHQTSLVHEGKNYKSAYFHTKDEAKNDLAQRILREKQYVFYGDAINRKLNVK